MAALLIGATDWHTVETLLDNYYLTSPLNRPMSRIRSSFLDSVDRVSGHRIGLLEHLVNRPKAGVLR
jgi:hypothetical protein